MATVQYWSALAFSGLKPQGEALTTPEPPAISRQNPILETAAGLTYGGTTTKSKLWLLAVDEQAERVSGMFGNISTVTADVNVSDKTSSMMVKQTLESHVLMMSSRPLPESLNEEVAARDHAGPTHS